tara:strand:- start:272 stop:571 length:300 start_codon:yes stop_codon:yes gene_type:complete
MLITGEQDDTLTVRSRPTNTPAVARYAMIRDFDGDTSTPRRRAKELCYEMLLAFSQEWCDCLDEETDAPLCEGNTERERNEISSQLSRITEQFAKYHKI